MRFICLLFCLLAARTLLAEDKPNFIFILTDDQRRDSLPCYGNEFVSTPHIDQLAADSLVFDKASITSAICTPSRATYFLGQYERRHAVNFNSGTAVSEAAWAQSYPFLLRKGGYFTGYVGKNHVPIGPAGYDSGVMEQSFDFFYAAHGHIFFYPKERHPIFQAAEADTQIEIIAEASENFLSTQPFIDGAISFLDQRNPAQPFCLSICLNVPHGAATSKMEQRQSDDPLYKSRYRDQIAQLSPPATYKPQNDAQPKLPTNLLLTQYRQNIYDYVNTESTLRERMLRQYQTITGIDRLVGSIRSQLERQNLADNTIIILTSDHGLMLGEHGLGGKALNYEPCLAVPLIIHSPMHSAMGQRSDALAQSIDIAPTLLDLAGLSTNESMQGLSLAPLLNDAGARLRDYAFAENLWSTIFGNPRIESVRNQQFKYIRYFANDHSPYSQRWQTKKYYGVSPSERRRYLASLTASIDGEQPVYEELYDLVNDPAETANLVGDQRYQEELLKLRLQCQQAVAKAYGDRDLEPSVSLLPLTLED